LALFGRRPPPRVDSLVMPASENLVWGLGSQAENSQHAIFSFNSISLFDLNPHFFAPTHSVQTLSRAGFVKVGRRSDISSCSRRCQAIPWQTRARQLARCGRDGRVEGSSLVAHEHSCRNLVFGGAAMTPDHDAVLRIGSESSEAADPFCTTAWKPWFLRTPPPRTVIGDPHRGADRAETFKLLATYIQ